ncbi:aminopeptidase P family protein [Candidatus Peregrinibacteria bacterium]|nr:aminopeptidase P family protein [Candidatus Peregrinibacteria bacterium]
MPIRPPLLVTDLVNIRYLTGIPLSAGSVLVRQIRSMLFVDDRYLEHAGYGRRGMRVRHIRELPHVLGRIRRCGFEAEHVTIVQVDSWKKKFPRTRFVPRTDVIEYLRRQKRPEELRALRRAERMTEEMLRRIPFVLRRKITEKELAWKLRLWAHDLGADALAFDPIVAFSAHTSQPHHHPTSRRLRKGDLVQIDVGAKYNGYCADRSAVYFTGEPTALQGKVHAAVKEALASVKAAVRAGVTNRALDRLARRVLHRHGFEREFCHALGHGVGLDIHEGVTLSEKAPLTKLLQSEVIAIEPGLYFPGKFGMRLEEMVYVR